MKRSDFLAIIPALSAIPLIGKNIVKTDGGIFIEKPVPIETNIPQPQIGYFDLRELRIGIFDKHDNIIGAAYIENFSYTMECVITNLAGIL